MRLAQDGNSLYMLTASRYFIYDKSFFYIGGQWYYLLDGRKFIVCDPTYIFSQVGQTMPEMSNESATVILLNKEQAKI